MFNVQYNIQNYFHFQNKGHGWLRWFWSLYLTSDKIHTLIPSSDVKLLEQQRRISKLVMMYKIQHQLVDIDRELYLRPGDSRTRGQHRFFQERSNYDPLRNSFQRTVREWNHLPDTTVGASSIEEFRANLQQQVSHANQCK